MCLGIAMKIVELVGEDEAVAELNSVRRKINIRLLPELKVGDYVIVHAGFAIQKVDEDEALEQIALYQEMTNMIRDENEDLV
ncbi:hypothetical protein DRQ00_08920 [candidate division KSB1 bacterium]|nr:MAG: hypothetical protein DRQ00_08920 [candidate division KSB1 bacterium]RKY88277.1 MAG: hypothetical protein DRQ11_04140 [candidate division KSB1 bacterium]